MKLKLDKALSLVAAGVISALQTVSAAPVYEIQNIESYDLNGTLESTVNGYGMSLNNNDQAVGLSMGKKQVQIDEDDDSVIDIEDGIPEAQIVTYSVLTEVIANYFTFTADANGSSGSWLPTFAAIFDSTAPQDIDEDNETIVNSVNTYFYGINDAGVKVGAYTAPEQKVTYTGSSDYDYWYFREFEERGFVKKADGTDISIAPPYTVYTEGSSDVTVGGMSTATAINNSNLITGYASTDISSSSASRIENCLDSDSVPVDVCVQTYQYPDNYGYRYILYQTRAMVWQLEDDDQVTPTELPVPDNLNQSGTRVYTAQGLGINSEGIVAGRSHVNRRGDTDKFAYDAAYWDKDSEGNYQYNWIEMEDKQLSSIAYDINDNGILVGSYRRYIDGYLRDKFFYYDTKATEPEVVTPNDFYSNMSDRSSRPRDINNNDQVVGYIEITSEKELPRSKGGFLFDKNTEEFSNLNDLLVCESKGYVQGDNGEWTRNQVQVVDGNGEVMSYESDIRIVEATSINDDGTIVGTAFMRKPSYQYDDDGNLVLGTNGTPLFELNANGQPVTAYIPRMVVLKPTSSGSACSVVEESESDTTATVDYERQGAASFVWLFALPLVWLRRRYKI